MLKLDKSVLRILLIVILVVSSVWLGFLLGNKADMNTDKGIVLMPGDSFSAEFSIPTTTNYDNRVFCPICKEKGLKSSVYEGSSQTTLVYNPTWYDEEGNKHYENTNTTTTYYSCSQGHEWYETYHLGETRTHVTKDTEDESEVYVPVQTDDLILWSQEEGSPTDDIIWTITSETSITFGDNVGKFSWENGVLDFEGNLTDSAEIFFDYLKPMIDEYIESKLKEGVSISTKSDDCAEYVKLECPVCHDKGLKSEIYDGVGHAWNSTTDFGSVTSLTCSLGHEWKIIKHGLNVDIEIIKDTENEVRPEEILFAITTGGVLKENFKPQEFLRVTDTDLSRCFINNRLKINLNGKRYWIQVEEDINDYNTNHQE